MKTSDRLFELLSEVKRLAREYHELTDKPLGVTGEVAEYEAARLLKIELAPARQEGYDAIRVGLAGEERVQIKGRRIRSTSRSGAQVGSINLATPWDSVVLVLLDEKFEPTAIYEAGREAITAALQAPGSRARNERGALSVSKFKQIGREVWHD